MSNNLIDLIQAEIKSLQIEINDGQLKCLVKYMNILKDSPRKSIASWKNDNEGVKIHFRDIMLNYSGHLKCDYFLDIGSGAGLPGIIYVILMPESRAVLMESRKSRADYLEEIVSGLGLKSRIEIVSGRAEELAHNKAYREKFDLVTARALAKMPVFLELSVAFIKPGGILQAIRGINDKLDLENYQPFLDHFGLKLINDKIYKLSDVDVERWSAIFQKNSATPDKYPRKIKKMGSL